LNTHQQLLVESLLHHHDRHERLSAIVERTRRLPHFPAEERIRANRVQGCSSAVWLICELTEGRCRFRSDADSPVVRGLVALTADFFSHSTPSEILTGKADPIELIDLNRYLTPTRRHGLAAVSAAIHAFATANLEQANRPIS
jgi:cysteine desulfuration protein SufE